MINLLPKQVDPVTASISLDENVIAGEESLLTNPDFILLTDSTALPPNSQIVSVSPSGRSLWVGTLRIEVRLKDGSSSVFFKKVCTR